MMEGRRGEDMAEGWPSGSTMMEGQRGDDMAEGRGGEGQIWVKFD
jgi:hypothetical protein